MSTNEACHCLRSHRAVEGDRIGRIIGSKRVIRHEGSVVYVARVDCPCCNGSGYITVQSTETDRDE